jgi:ethanolamine utilization protein EutA
MQTDALRHDYEIDEFWISGGVAECMQEIFTSGGVAECIEISTSGGVAERRQENSAGGNNASSADRFGDMGVRIAKALPGAFCDRNLQYRIGEQAIRATVIGAGMHSMQLSGSTIWVSRDRLPLRNVQILRPFVDTRAELSAAQIKESIKAILANFRLDESASSFAIELCDLSRLSYSALQTWAAVFAEMFGSESQIAAVKESGNTSSSAVAQEPLILLSREDIGMALGQSIHKYAPELELIVLDGIDTAYGDYLDIGRPLANQEAIPLTVKTLIFRQD